MGRGGGGGWTGVGDVRSLAVYHPKADRHTGSQTDKQVQTGSQTNRYRHASDRQIATARQSDKQV